MSIEFIDLPDAARACLIAVVDRFNTEDPFWSAFVPDPDQTRLTADGFSVTVRGLGCELEVIGKVARERSAAGGVAPTVSVGAKRSSSPRPRRWHPVDCSVDASGRFSTANFRKAIEASIVDASDRVRV